MTPTQRRGLAMCVLVTVLTVLPVALGGAATATHTRVTTSQSEAEAIKQVKWTSNVTVSFAHGSWAFVSEGVPPSNFVAANYAVPSNPFDVSATGASIHASASVLEDQHYDYTLPLTPQYSKTVTATNQGPIGIMLDGAALYNPYEANHSTVATADNFVATENGVSASFLDDCDGHPGPGGEVPLPRTARVPGRVCNGRKSDREVGDDDERRHDGGRRRKQRRVKEASRSSDSPLTDTGSTTTSR